jgi:hypothetical protein
VHSDIFADTVVTSAADVVAQQLSPSAAPEDGAQPSIQPTLAGATATQLPTGSGMGTSKGQGIFVVAKGSIPDTPKGKGFYYSVKSESKKSSKSKSVGGKGKGYDQDFEFELEHFVFKGKGQLPPSGAPKDGGQLSIQPTLEGATQLPTGSGMETSKGKGNFVTKGAIPETPKGKGPYYSVKSESKKSGGKAGSKSKSADGKGYDQEFEFELEHFVFEGKGQPLETEAPGYPKKQKKTGSRKGTGMDLHHSKGKGLIPELPGKGSAKGYYSSKNKKSKSKGVTKGHHHYPAKGSSFPTISPSPTKAPSPTFQPAPTIPPGLQTTTPVLQTTTPGQPTSTTGSPGGPSTPSDPPVAGPGGTSKKLCSSQCKTPKLPGNNAHHYSPFYFFIYIHSSSPGSGRGRSVDSFQCTLRTSSR